MKKLIILSPSPIADNNWRLHRNQADFTAIRNQGVCETLIFDLPGRRNPLSFPAPRNYNNYPKGGALYNGEISKWIVKRGYTHNCSNGEKPNRLLFELTINENVHIYRFRGRVIDYRK